MAVPGSISKELNNLNSSTLIQSLEKSVVDNIFDQNPTFKKLYDKAKTFDGGTTITVPVMYDTKSATNFSGFQTLTPAEKELTTTLQFDRAHYVTDVTISYTDQIANSGKSEIFDLLEMKFENAQLSMEKSLSTDLFTARTSANQLWSLPDAIAVDPTSNPSYGNYGNIDRSTYDWYRNVYDIDGHTTSAMTFADVQDCYQDVCDVGIKPDLIVTCDNIYNRLWSIADGRQRLGNEKMNTAHAGVANIDFNGTPIVADKNCPDKYMYMLNSKYAYFKVHKSRFNWTPFLQPHNQLGFIKYLRITLQLVVTNPRYCAVFRASS